ncbi:MAG: AraC family transcriptional regulator [Cyclobacteriaceae bacterium]|nr:AraC family transcriptional regulator [Cyclobacteriaceae bacterium]
MFLRFYQPHPALQEIVSRIMLARYVFEPGTPLPATPFPPHPEQCLYFYPFDMVSSHNYATDTYNHLPQSIVVGPQLARVDLTMGYDMLIIYVGFHPGGLYRLLHVPMQEIINTPIDATLLLGNEIEMVTAQLQDAKHYDAMIRIVENYLLQKKKLKQPLPLDQVLRTVVNQAHALHVDKMASDACVSVRQLERQFNERIGMSPKMFFRLVRFSKAWRLRESNATMKWASIAYQCGYADQMHMIRDFKEFANVPPTLLLEALQQSNLRLQAELYGDPLL